jgi:hypothetical protein
MFQEQLSKAFKKVTLIFIPMRSNKLFKISPTFALRYLAVDKRRQL